MIADSKCAISAVRLTNSLLPHFRNSVAEIRENMELIKKFWTMEDVHYVDTSLNLADISTKATAILSELEPDRFHQAGPEFISFHRSSWSVSMEYSPHLRDSS